MPKDAVLLGRSANDAWAVLRLKNKEAGKERIVRWDVQKQAEEGVLPDVGRIPDFVLVSSDGRRMAYIDPFAVKTGETVCVVGLAMGPLRAVLDTGYPQGGGKDLASLGGFSPNGEKLITRGRDHYLPTWQVDSGRLFTRIHDSNYKIAGCQWSPDGRKLAIVGPPAFEMPHGGNGDGIFLQLWGVRYPSPSYASRESIDSHQSSRSPIFSPAGQSLAWSGHFWKPAAAAMTRFWKRWKTEQATSTLGPTAHAGSSVSLFPRTAPPGKPCMPSVWGPIPSPEPCCCPRARRYPK